MPDFLVVGGDRRMGLLARLLTEDGLTVDTLGLRPGDEKTARVGEAKVLLFPYPVSVKNGRVPTQTGLRIRPEEILAQAKPEATVLAGGGLEQTVLCYEQAEGFAQRNAELSAESALGEVMQRSERALMDMRLLITGYGLFGRALALRCRAMGAEICIAARREAARQQARTDGMEAIPLEEMGERAAQVHMLLNTVPAWIIGEDVLKALPESAWLLELASAPYGFDREAAERLHPRFEILPGLPGKCVPLSAALTLKDACLALLKEEQP